MGIKERQERDREAVRRAILDAARELFVTEGYQNVSIRKIAERIEYSPAAIYGYFSSKDDIFFALAEEGFRPAGRPRRRPRGLSCRTAPAGRARPAPTSWRLYEFSREQPRALRADVRRPIGPAHQPRVRALCVRARDEGAHCRGASRRASTPASFRRRSIRRRDANADGRDPRRRRRCACRIVWRPARTPITSRRT